MACKRLVRSQGRAEPNAGLAALSLPPFRQSLTSAVSLAAGAAAQEEAGKGRVTFADVLASSLQPVAEMRAWFNEERGAAKPVKLHSKARGLDMLLASCAVPQTGLSDVW